MAEGVKQRVKYGADILYTLKEYPCLKKIISDWKDGFPVLSSSKVNKIMGHELVEKFGFITSNTVNQILEKLLCHECDKELTKGTTHICKKCGHSFCPEHIYTYVDGNNIAITRNSPEYCEKCYWEVYGR